MSLEFRQNIIILLLLLLFLLINNSLKSTYIYILMDDFFSLWNDKILGWGSVYIYNNNVKLMKKMTCNIELIKGSIYVPCP